MPVRSGAQKHHSQKRLTASDDDIDDFAGDNHDAFDRLILGIAGETRICAYVVFYVGGWKVGWQLYMEAEFAIDGDGVGDSFGLERGRVIRRPRSLLEWGGVPESFPEFGSYVGRKRLQKYQYRLPDSAFSASEALHFIEEGHEVGDAGVEA
jgi:hypothetical protein